MRTFFYTLSLVMALTMTVEVAMAQPKHSAGLRFTLPNYVSPRFADFGEDEAGFGDVFSEVDGWMIEGFYDHRIARNTFIEIPLKYGQARVPRLSLDNNPSEDDHSIFCMDALVKHQFLRHGSRVNPYAHFGLGFSTDDQEGEDTDLNIPLGLGLNVRLTDKLYASLQTQYRTSTRRREAWHHGIGLHYNFGADLDDQMDAELGKDGNQDTDGDGIVNNLDRCPTTPGPAATNGCPDRDGDGIADIEDRCPDVAGARTNGGCPEISTEDKVILANAVRQVQFQTEKATLLPNSLPVLDEVARLMKKYPSYNLSIEGHTDSTGDDKFNLQLSKDRAKACYDYLIGKGIQANRMKHNGFGESRPVADNNTAEGREQNRRVEFLMSAN